MRKAAAVALVATGLLGSPASAQPEQVAVLFVGSAPERSPARWRTWRVHVERAARIAGYAVVDDPVAYAQERLRAWGPIPPARVEGLREVEQLLVEARRASATLREGEALGRLARAEQLVRDHADVAGAAAWLAEVQTAMGVTAAQAGIPALVEVALSRAATLDPSRGVHAAEAPPAVVARARAIARAVATRSTGSFEVRTDAEGARVFLDDEDLGPAPRIVRAPVGTHVLRVQAPGRLPWGRIVEVLEGRRPPVEVRLAPDPLVSHARLLRRAAEDHDGSAVAAALRALPGIGAAWIVEIGDGARDRALLTACSVEDCAETRRLSVDEVPIVIPRRAPHRERLPAADVTSHRAWLREPAPPPPPPPPPTAWWERWYLWAGAAVIVGATVGGALWLTRPEPRESRRVVIDPMF